MDIGQIFENNFDCYADTWQDNNDTIPPTMVEGDVVMAMTKEAFIKVFKELTSTDVSQQRELPQEVFIEGYKQRAEESDLIFDNASRMYAISLFDKWKNNK